MKNKIVIAFFFVFHFSKIYANQFDLKFNLDSAKFKKRKQITHITLLTTTAITHSALYVAWYRNSRSIPFHWHNDNKQWLQMDKLGHAWSANFAVNQSYRAYKWAGYSQRKSALLAMGVSVLFQTPIEYFDGLSPDYGASWGDLTANMSGTLFSGIQHYAWGKRKIYLRFSTRLTDFAAIRPNILGSNLAERILKDYNGQTYWLEFVPERMGWKSENWPRWLGFAAGYGARGMLGGHDNIWQDKFGNIFDYSSQKRYREFLLAPTICFEMFRNHKNKWLRALCIFTDLVRIPMPGIGYTTQGKLYWNWLR